MTLALGTLKWCRFVPSAAFRQYHPSLSLLKWPSVLRDSQVAKPTMKKAKIWKGMTIWDLAMSLRKDVDYMNEVLKPLFTSKMDVLSGQITDLHSIKHFLKKENVEYAVIEKVTNNLSPSKTKSKIAEIDTHSKNEVSRPPIVTIMGHVDHGKTTLLDALRNSNIVGKEFGGITQHIGAFSVTLSPGKTVTFIDTPGHAAFSAMRNRGAEVTDIVVLIVAADDGVMEQTIESIKMAKNAGVGVIVAVNKIDKGENNMAIIKQQLLKEGIQAEDLGGDVQFVPISALKRINLDLLVETILLESEMMCLKGDPTAPVEGVIIESSVGSKGKVATVIVKRGTLRKRALLVAGSALARVRGMFDEDGRELSEVTLSQPAQIIGWKELPNAGEKVIEVDSQKEANALIKEEKKNSLKQKMLEDYVFVMDNAVKEKADFARKKTKLAELRAAGDIEGLKEFFSRKPADKTEEKPKLNIIVKGDVDGSVDAILHVLDSYDCDDECKLNLIHYGVGEVTKSDLELAKTFNAIVYCFNLNFPQHLKSDIVSNDIIIRFHNVIYKFIDDLKAELSIRLPEVEEDEIIGTGEVLQHFLINEGKRKVPVAGSVCLTGEFSRKMIFRVIRDDQVLHEGEVRSLKHFKNEVNTIKKDTQCGIMFHDFQGEFKSGDKIICFEKKLVRYPSSWDPGF